MASRTAPGLSITKMGFTFTGELLAKIRPGEVKVTGTPGLCLRILLLEDFLRVDLCRYKFSVGDEPLLLSRDAQFVSSHP